MDNEISIKQAKIVNVWNLGYKCFIVVFDRPDGALQEKIRDNFPEHQFLFICEELSASHS